MMKKKYLYFGMALASAVALATDEPFNLTMKMLQPIVITENNALVFPNTAIGSVVDVPVLTTDSGAADFSATGSAGVSFTKSVVEANITMEKDGASGGDPMKEIQVDTFSLAGPAAFDVTGNATGLKVGATAHVLANDIAGDYIGVATFRIIY